MKTQNNDSVKDQTATCDNAVLSPVYLTVQQLSKACSEHDFILARFSSGHLMGINTKVADIVLRKKVLNPNAFTSYVGFIPCDFQTYISYKHGFC